MGAHSPTTTGTGAWTRMMLIGLAASLLALPSAAAATTGGPVAPTTHTADPAGVRGYWTAARMRSAAPLQGGEPTTRGSTTAAAAVQPGLDREQIPDPSADPYSSHGKVFLTITGGDAPGDYVCSGTAIAAPPSAAATAEGVVWTAGHCVYDTGGGYASNWMFVPGYEDGAAPFGEWPATGLLALERWSRDGNLASDLGAAVVGPDPQGRSLPELVGGRGIAFDQPRAQLYSSFGYPALAPPIEFDGERLFSCTSVGGLSDNPPGPGPQTLSIPCDMTAGSSGGGWVADGSLLSVNSYSYCDEGSCEPVLYGPYHGDQAQALYESVAPAAEFCGGRQVTIAGGPGSDNLVGTSGPDVFKARAGDDRIAGKGGNDTACGGGGDDVLLGKGGNDSLYGNQGTDTLRAGPGDDACEGGSGKDRAKGCETVSGASDAG